MYQSIDSLDVPAITHYQAMQNLLPYLPYLELAWEVYTAHPIPDHIGCTMQSAPLAHESNHDYPNYPDEAGIQHCKGFDNLTGPTAFALLGACRSVIQFSFHK